MNRAGGRHVHRSADGLRAFYELLFSNGGGIPLEHCASTDDGRRCALEYTLVWWGRTEIPRKRASRFTCAATAVGTFIRRQC